MIVRAVVAVAMALWLSACADPSSPTSETTVTVTTTTTIPVVVPATPRRSTEPWSALHNSTDPACAELINLRQQATDAALAAVNALQHADDLRNDGAPYNDYQDAFDAYIRQQQASQRLQQSVTDMEASC